MHAACCPQQRQSVGILLAEPVLQHGVDPLLLVCGEGHARSVAKPAPIHRLRDRITEGPITGGM